MAEKSKNLPYIGTLTLEPVKTTVSVNGSKGESSYQKKSQISYRDKESGSYGRATTTENDLNAEFRWKNGISGVKNENKTSSTLRIGNQRGYAEVYREERFRTVTFDKNSGGKTQLPICDYRHKHVVPCFVRDSDSDSDGYAFNSYSEDSDSDY